MLRAPYFTAIKNFKFTNSQGDTIEYSGEVSNGLPNGQGTGIFFDTAEESYTGTWINGVPNGYGTMKVSQPNGSKFVYTGQISNGQANGQGTLSFTEGPYKGDSYFGPFKNNNFHTEGILLLTLKNLFIYTKEYCFRQSNWKVHYIWRRSLWGILWQYYP